MKNKHLLFLAVGAMMHVSTLQAQFGSDVKTFSRPAVNEQQVSLDVAFNGWVYEAFSIDSGFILVMSKDNGNTWLNPDTVILEGYQFSVRIVVAGSDTNYLRVYMAVNKLDSVSGLSTLYINVFDGSNDAFITNQTIDSYNDPTRGFDIATDYKFPSQVSSPYAIGVLYAKASPLDSLFLVVSTDSGADYGAKQLVAVTPTYFHKVSLAYGLCASYFDGRFFMAWEHFFAATDTVGNIFTSYTPNLITDVPAAPVNIDSIYPTTAYQMRNPRIAASQSATTCNDSGNVTALIVMERIATGLTNSNILGFDNLSAVAGNYWTGFDIVNTLQNTVQPDVSFDPGYSNFLLTYYNAGTNQLPYIVNEFNLTNPGSWGTVTQNYVDDSSKLVNPWPTVRINPVYTKVAVGWNNTYNGRQQAMFDAEYRVPTPVVISLSPDSVFAGSAQFILGVNGEKFRNNSYIMWNTDSLATTYISGNELTAAIPAGLVTTPSTVPVTVVTPSPTGGGGPSNSVTFEVMMVSAINDLGGLNTVLVYPNPAADELNIAYAFTQPGEMEVHLYDLSGKLVKNLNRLDYVSGNGTITEDVSNLSQGLYLLVINTDQGSATRKISIVR